MAKAATKPNSDIAYLCRALKAPSLVAAVERLAERARAEGWTHEEFLAACLEREVASRQDHGGENRIRAARFPARKSLEDFDFDHQRSLKRDVIAHLGTLDFVDAKDNIVFLGPPGTGKTHLATGLGIRACQAGHRVAFATAAGWVARHQRSWAKHRTITDPDHQRAGKIMRAFAATVCDDDDVEVRDLSVYDRATGVA